MWPTGEVRDRRGGVDTEVPVDGREYVVWVVLGFDRHLTIRIGGADDVSAANSSTREENAHQGAPVVASGLLVDTRGTSELSDRDDEDVAV